MSSCSNILYTFTCSQSGESLCILAYDALTCCQWTCLPVEGSAQFWSNCCSVLFLSFETCCCIWFRMRSYLQKSLKLMLSSTKDNHRFCSCFVGIMLLVVVLAEYFRNHWRWKVHQVSFECLWVSVVSPVWSWSRSAEHKDPALSWCLKTQTNSDELRTHTHSSHTVRMMRVWAELRTHLYHQHAWMH